MSAVPESPYKGLASFADTHVDALLFFGRDDESAAIVANLLTNRLTVLYGPSGVGKSSLLRAGVAQRLRAMTGAAVIVHDAWADDPVGSLIESVRTACPQLGPAAGVVDTISAAAQANGEAYLLFDQFEDYFLYHGEGGPLRDALPELVQRPGLRVHVLIAIRDDALAELDLFAGRMPSVFENIVRLDRLGRAAARTAIVGPLERFRELTSGEQDAEPALVEALLDAVSVDGEHIETPYLQLVLETLWPTLRIEHLEQLGGAQAIVREHVEGTLDRLPEDAQDATARALRQLVTPTGRTVALSTSDLADYVGLPENALRRLLETLARERIVRAVDGIPGGTARYEVFHDVLAEPVLAWRAEHDVERERRASRRQRRRLLALVALALTIALVVAGIAVYAHVQAQRAHARELAADALAALPTDPAAGVSLALRAAELSPGAQEEDVLRQSLLALRERKVVPLGGRIVAAAFSPRSDELLLASSGGRAGIYAADGTRLTALKVPAPVTHAVWSDDGSLVAVGSEGGTVTVFRAETGTAVATVRTPSPVVALSYTGRTLLVGSGAHLRIVHGARARTIGVPGAVVAAALAPNERDVAVATRRRGIVTTRLVDVGGRARIRKVLPERGVVSLRFNGNGRLLVTGSADRTARIWDATSGRQLHLLQHKGTVLSERFSRNGKLLVTASTDGTAGVWDVATGSRLLLLTGATGAAEDAAFSPDGDIALANADRIARIYSSDDGRLLAAFAGHNDTVTSVSFDPTGRTLVTGSDDGTARLWDANVNNLLTVVDSRREPVRVRFAGERLVTVADSEARLVTTGGRVLHVRKTTQPIVGFATHGDAFAVGPNAVAYAPDGALFTVAGATEVAAGRSHSVALMRNGSVVVYDRSGRSVVTLHGRAQQIAISSDGDTVATSRARDAYLWNASTGELLHKLHGHRSLVTDVKFSPDGSRVVTASVDHDSRTWDVASGRLLHILRGHFFTVRTAEFSPDGRWIVTSSQFTAGLWNAETGELEYYLRAHTKPLTGATFSADGHWIGTGSDDGTARVEQCDICTNLAGLEQLARARLRDVR
jgi:WD40 repeat protein